jgi:hypothetical protein
MPIMAAGDVKVQWASTGLIWLSSLNKLTCVEFSVVLGPESLNGHVDALGVGPAEYFCQLAGPVHGLFLDLNSFLFVR